jgi:Uma2 family endonuclease
MVATPTKPLTLEEFLSLPEIKPASEYIEKKIIQKPMPKGKHSLLQLELISFINVALRKSGVAIAFPELRCTFGGQSIVPDVVILKTENVLKDEQGEIINDFNLAPNWMIEILSPDQNTTPVITKILHSLKHGTEVGWLIDPAEKSIFVYHSQNKVEIVDDFNQALIVPKFAELVTLTAEEIFSWLRLG